MATGSFGTPLDRPGRSGRPDRPDGAVSPAVRAAAQSRAAGFLAQARHGLLEAASAERPAERYATAHLAALRAAAAVLAARARPDTGRRRSAPRDAWSLLAAVAPELGEWALFFAAGAGKRAAAEAGVTGAVTVREADDLLRDVETFLAVVATTIGVPDQSVLQFLPGLDRQAG